MVNKFHVEPRNVNDSFSRDVYNDILAETDEDKIYFTRDDINKLSTYTTTLDDEIKQRKTGFLTLLTSLYQQRLKQADSLIDEINKKPFDFNTPEKLTVAEDTTYPQSLAAMKTKLYKKIKLDALDELVDDLPGKFKSLPPANQKKYIDSAEAAIRKKVLSSFKRKINNILQNPYGMVQYVGNIYCENIASCFDPHSEYFPPAEKENFESELGKQPFRFGFRMKADKEGGVLIDNLEPGSLAFKSGKLNKGDKFMSLQWEGKQPVDVSDISPNEFSALIEQSNHSNVQFTIKKTDGSVVQVSLAKEQKTDDEDDDKVKSFILKGANTIGYIYLPAFYEDWETANDGLNGCANDVGREILKLKKENINGLILDLRYNGGGSAQEATEQAGIFIDAGPVAQDKSRGEKVYTMKDINRGTIYDGPLVILVNGYSASASELLAGTLQDYNRAIIIGSPTYGKATAQVVFPMDTTVTYETLKQIQTENYIKITISKLYRITGTTAQFKGVQPDIALPDILDAYTTKEAGAPYALRPTVIDANKYFKPYPPLPVKTLAESVQTEIDTSKYFNSIKSFVANAKKEVQAKDVSLSLKDALAEERKDDGTNEDDAIIPQAATKKYTVQNNQFEISRLQADSYMKELNEEFRTHISADAYIMIAYDVLSKLKPQ